MKQVQQLKSILVENVEELRRLTLILRQLRLHFTEKLGKLVDFRAQLGRLVEAGFRPFLFGDLLHHAGEGICVAIQLLVEIFEAVKVLSKDNLAGSLELTQPL